MLFSCQLSFLKEIVAQHRLWLPQCKNFSGILVSLIDMIYLLTAIGLTPGDSITVHIYKQTVHKTTQITTEQHN